MTAHPVPDTGDLDARLQSLVYATIGNPGAWTDFIEALAASYSGGRGLIAVHDPKARDGSAHPGSFWEAGAYAAYNSHYVKTNPWIPHLARREIGKVVRSYNVVPRQDLLRTEFYNDMLRRHDVDDETGVTIQRDAGRYMVVTVLQPHEALESDLDSAGRMQRLVPHLLRAAQLNRRFAEWRRARRGRRLRWTGWKPGCCSSTRGRRWLMRTLPRSGYCRPGTVYRLSGACFRWPANPRLCGI